MKSHTLDFRVPRNAGISFSKSNGRVTGLSPEDAREVKRVTESGHVSDLLDGKIGMQQKTSRTADSQMKHIRHGADAYFFFEKPPQMVNRQMHFTGELSKREVGIGMLLVENLQRLAHVLVSSCFARRRRETVFIDHAQQAQEAGFELNSR